MANISFNYGVNESASLLGETTAQRKPSAVNTDCYIFGINKLRKALFLICKKPDDQSRSVRSDDLITVDYCPTADMLHQRAKVRRL